MDTTTTENYPSPVNAPRGNNISLSFCSFAQEKYNINGGEYLFLMRKMCKLTLLLKQDREKRNVRIQRQEMWAGRMITELEI